MKVLVLGSNGFIGKNLLAYLQSMSDVTILEHHYQEQEESLREKCKQADCVFHLAGISRPADISEFESANVTYFASLLRILTEVQNPCPVMLASSIQAAMESPYGVTEYGRTKKEAEDLLLDYGKRTGACVLIYRLPHLFGPFGCPEYNNVMHTFVHHIANGLPVRVDCPDTKLQLLYVEDLVKEIFVSISDVSLNGYCPITSPVYEKTLGEVVDILTQLRDDSIPKSEAFEEKLAESMDYYRAENDSVS